MCQSSPPLQEKGKAGVSNLAFWKGPILGNLLIGLGLALGCILGGAFAYTRLELWLDSQELHVVAAPLDEQTLASFAPIAPLALPPAKGLPSTLLTARATALPVVNFPARAIPQTVPPATPTPAVYVPVHITIPKINVNSRIVEITPRSDGEWATAAYAVGYHKGTGLVGEADNVILSGHNNYQGEVFKRLDELRVGDLILLYAGEHEYHYRVVDTAIIRWTGATEEEKRRHIQFLLPTTEPTLTLISCWPYWFYTHRIYIVAKPVPS